jgi:hypothetical protein
MEQGAEKSDAGAEEFSEDTAGGRHGLLRQRWTLEQLLIAAGLGVMIVAAVIFTNGDVGLLELSAVLLAPGIILTGLLFWRPRPGVYLAAGIANSALTIIALPLGLPLALANPLLFPRYQGYVLSALSLLLALPAGISGYLQGRWSLLRPSLIDRVRGLHGLATIAVVSLSVGAMVAGALAYQHIPGPPGPPEAIDFAAPIVGVVASDSRFQPNAFNVTAGVVTEIVVLNEDSTAHSFTYTSNGVTYSHDVFSGGTARFLVLFSARGTIPFRSSAPGDPKMMGNITVT